LNFIFGPIQLEVATSIFKNSFWLFADQLIRILLSIIVGSWTARYLGKRDFGQLSFVISYLTLFQIITGLGADSFVIRDLVFNRNNSNKILGSIFYLRLIFGLSNWVLSTIFIFLLFGSNDSAYILSGIAGLSLVFQSASTIEIWFQSENISYKIVLPKLIATIIINALKILAIIQNVSIEYFAFLFSLDFILAALFLFFTNSSYKIAHKWFFDSKYAKSILSDSWPFLLSAVSIFLYTRIDSFIIKKLIGSADLGIYTASLNISTMLPVLPMILFNVLMPVVSKIKKESEKDYTLFLSRIFRSFSIIGILFSLFIYLFAFDIVHILYGNEYINSVKILRVHIFSNVFIYIGIAQNFWIINENKGRLNIIKTTTGVILSITLNLILIPQLGLIGAAISAVIVQLISSFLINLIIAPEIFKIQFNSLFFIHR
jgi:PST family polysaccharide transporter